MNDYEDVIIEILNSLGHSTLSNWFTVLVLTGITCFLLGEKQFKCDQCDFACIQSFDLVKHKYTHGGQKPYKCVHCSKDFTRPARLREHMRQHTGEKPFKCTQCGKAFSQMTSLKSHLVSVLFKMIYFLTMSSGVAAIVPLLSIIIIIIIINLFKIGFYNSLS